MFLSTGLHFSFKWCLCHSHSVPRMLVLALYNLGWVGTISFEKCVTLNGTTLHTTNYGLKKKPDRYYRYYGRGEETVVVKIQTFMRDAGCNLICLIPVSRSVVVFLYAISHLTSVLSQACMQIKKLNSCQKVWSYFVNLTPALQLYNLANLSQLACSKLHCPMYIMCNLAYIMLCILYHVGLHTPHLNTIWIQTV